MTPITGTPHPQVGQPIAGNSNRVTPAASTTEYTKASSSASGSSSPSSQLSTLAQQLSDSALRAEERDNALSRKELGVRAEELLGQILGPNYTANKARHDSEVPNTDDPALLARAKQATDFVNTANSSRATPNPFAGLSNDQLTLIIYDDSGAYTVNERRAAYYEAAEQRQAWKREVVAKAIAEYNSTGKMTNFYSEVLAYYESLPPIEQAQYPVGYTENLQQRVDDDTDHRPKAAQTPDPFNLFAVLDRLNTHGPESK
ncbi:hypothetical protein [Vreelandella hamiltonii]|uniref:Uncharacterized protein n=2 Tax=Halomonadaceae TaxID=28256 RepID=A0A8H9IBX8_9GAMM|nr:MULTISPECIES: hypothetical protein [Halomonas]GGW42329.1 hypothetical protein GCM10007157_35730 [Halomonas hamiltonii]GGW71751.1 hypothetical protein GCM10007158_35130 [Halomonas johnsoniae]